MGLPGVLAVRCHTYMNSYWRPLVLEGSLAPPQALMIELAYSVLVLFSVTVIRHPNKGCVRQKGLIWLTIPAYSPSLQGGQGNRNLKQPSHYNHGKEQRSMGCYTQACAQLDFSTST